MASLKSPVLSKNSGMFEPLRFEFDGQTYTIPNDKIMLAMEEVENRAGNYFVIGQEINKLVDGHIQNIKFTTLAKAFHVILEAAGAEIDYRQVYQQVADISKVATISVIVHTLMNLMAPQGIFAEAVEESKETEAEKKPQDQPKKRVRVHAQS